MLDQSQGFWCMSLARSGSPLLIFRLDTTEVINDRTHGPTHFNNPAVLQRQ